MSDLFFFPFYGIMAVFVSSEISLGGSDQQDLLKSKDVECAD